MCDQNTNTADPARQIALICSNCGWGSGKISAEQGPIELLNAGIAHRLGASVVIVSVDPSMRSCQTPDQGIEATIMEHASNVSDAVVGAVERGLFPVVIGGDHTSALGFYTGLSRAYGQTGIVYIDAHPDLNTLETSPSGNIHGMILAGLLGRGSKAMLQTTHSCQTKDEHVAMVGTRSIDEGEQRWLDEGKIRYMTMDTVRKRGLSRCMQDAVETANQASAGFGLTIDIDAIDPSQSPFVATPVENGLDADDLIATLSSLPLSDRLLGMEVTEFTPRQDEDAYPAVELITSLVTAVMGTPVV